MVPQLLSSQQDLSHLFLPTSLCSSSQKISSLLRLLTIRTISKWSSSKSSKLSQSLTLHSLICRQYMSRLKFRRWSSKVKSLFLTRILFKLWDSSNQLKRSHLRTHFSSTLRTKKRIWETTNLRIPSRNGLLLRTIMIYSARILKNVSKLWFLSRMLQNFITDTKMIFNSSGHRTIAKCFSHKAMTSSWKTLSPIDFKLTW